MTRAFPKKVKLAAWRRAYGKCEGCGAKLWPGKFDYDHITPHGLGGDNSLENCAVLCSGPGSCHERKTGKRDVPMIAKTKRQRDKHLGIAKSKSRLSHPTLKRKMDGTVVNRETGEVV